MTLCIWPVAPDPNGDGASQRAWYMLNALARVEPVDLVLLHQVDRPELEAISLQHAHRVARSVKVVRVPSWCTSSALMGQIPSGIGRVVDLARLGSVEVPRLSLPALNEIAAHLPRQVETVFVGRLSTACIVDDLCRHGLLKAKRRVVDFDDLMSRFRRLQLHHQAAQSGPLRRYWQTFIAQRIEAAESRIIGTWDECAVASGEDAAFLRSAYPGTRVHHLPNVLERTPCADTPDTDADTPFNLLFVGNLRYPPNVEGVDFLLDRIWPELRRSDTGIAMSIVGRAPDPALADRIRSAGIALYTDVADVRPFYDAASAVVAPIFFGGGTRIKILEAMAFQKAIVATTFAVEGLCVEHGVHAMLGDTADALIASIRSLSRDTSARTRLAFNARRHQRDRYSSAALDKAVSSLLRMRSAKAAPQSAPAINDATGHTTWLRQPRYA